MNNLLNQDVSKTAYGRRTVFRQLVCLSEDNLFSGSENDPSFWLTDATGADTVNSTPDFLRMAGGTDYRKWFTVRPQTWYYLLFDGKVDPACFSDFIFGMVDGEGKRHTMQEKGYFVTDFGLDDELTIMGQDGSWYPRIYKFFSGENTRLAFFAQGSEGTVFLKNIQVCEATRIRTCIESDKSDVHQWIEDDFCCDEQDNLASPSLVDWEAPYGYGRFVEKDGSRLTYQDSGRGCYYLVWLPVESGRLYTGSFWYRVKKAGGARFGFIWQHSDGRRGSRALMSAGSEGGWKKSSIDFALAEGARLAFAVYDGGGEVEMDNIRVFLNGCGYATEEDCPTD